MILYLFIFSVNLQYIHRPHTHIFFISRLLWPFELGGGGVVYQSNHFLLCLLSFSFSPYEHNDTDKVFFGASMK